MPGGTANFKRFLQLLEKFPVVEGRTGRDLGEFLRTYITKAYKEDKFATNQKYWDLQYLALQRLYNNEAKNKYKRILSSSATGLNAEQCQHVLSNDFLEELKEEDKPFYKKIFKRE